MGWPKGVPRKPREIVQQDNSAITAPVAPDGTTFKETEDEGGFIQNAPAPRPFNMSQRERMEQHYKEDVLGIKEEPTPPKTEEPVTETKPATESEVKVEKPLRPTVVVKPTEEPVKPTEAKPQEPASPTPAIQPKEEEMTEREKAAVKRMHEATQEAAELRRREKQWLDMIAQFKGPTVEPPKKEEPQLLTAEQKLEMLQNDPVGYLERIEQEAIAKAEERIFGKLGEKEKLTVQQQQIKTFQEKLDTRFREKFPDLSDPLFEDIIDRVSFQLGSTQEGAMSLVSNPEGFLDTVAEKVRPRIEALKSKFNPGTSVTTEPVAPAQQPTGQEIRERIPASPVVKPSGTVVPAGPTEEKPETPQETVNNRRLQQKRIFGQVAV